MLALSEMKVVFVPKKKITLGGEESPTADRDLNASKVEVLTLHSDESGGNAGVKRGKPLKRET